MHAKLLSAAALLVASSSLVTGQGLYTKSSPVLQLDAKSYDRLIAKSNYTSIVEFYAPWCGHCKTLKPVYEKAATSLSGIAKVAAVNCDDDSNKPFCGSMGVKGFPTLKIVKPAKKAGGKPIVEDYMGQRTAKAISDAVADKVPNHVQRVKDDSLDKFLTASPERPKALFFSEKGIVPAMVKALAIDFLGGVDFGFVQSRDKKAVQKFDVKSSPSVLLLEAESDMPITYDGEVKKEPLIEFFSQVMSPHPDSAPMAAKKSDGSKKFKQDSKKASKKPSSDPDAAKCPHNTESSTEATPLVTSLDTEAALKKACLQSRSGTCIIALVPSRGSDINDASKEVAKSLEDVAIKHIHRGAKMFPFYTLPDSNKGAKTLADALKLKEAGFQVIAVNAKRAWWTSYIGKEPSSKNLGDWIDGIRLGDFDKQKLPEDLVEGSGDDVKGASPVKVNVVEETKEDSDVPEKEL